MNVSEAIVNSPRGAAVQVGDPAPDLALPNQDGQMIQLSHEWQQGPIVLAFFPAAFSRVCTSEMCTFRDSSPLESLNARVFGVSVDSFFTLKAWRETMSLPFPLLSDFNRMAIQAYAVWNDDLYGMRGTARRAVFLIDRHGRVAHLQVLEEVSQEPDYAALAAAIATLHADTRG